MSKSLILSMLGCLSAAALIGVVGGCATAPLDEPEGSEQGVGEVDGTTLREAELVQSFSSEYDTKISFAEGRIWINNGRGITDKKKSVHSAGTGVRLEGLSASGKFLTTFEYPERKTSTSLLAIDVTQVKPARRLEVGVVARTAPPVMDRAGMLYYVGEDATTGDQKPTHLMRVGPDDDKPLRLASDFLSRPENCRLTKLSLDREKVYGLQSCRNKVSEIVTVSLGGGSAEVLTGYDGPIVDMAVTDDAIYYSTTSWGKDAAPALRRVGKGNAKSTTLLQGKSVSRARLAVNDGVVVASTDEGHEILQLSAAGGAPKTLGKVTPKQGMTSSFEQLVLANGFVYALVLDAAGEDLDWRIVRLPLAK